MKYEMKEIQDLIDTDFMKALKDYIVKEYYKHLPLEASTTSIIILINSFYL